MQEEAAFRNPAKERLRAGDVALGLIVRLARPAEIARIARATATPGPSIATSGPVSRTPPGPSSEVFSRIRPSGVATAQKRSTGVVTRLPPRVKVATDDVIHIGVRRELLHFFEPGGARIDVGFR